MCAIKPLHCLFYTCSCWPTGWTCHMARWAASCAAAPGRRCSPASSCAMQICTLPPAWIWCITPSITSSWLLQSWSALLFGQTSQKGDVCLFHHLSWESFFFSLRCPTRLFLRHLQTLCHRHLLSTAILSQTKTEVTDLYDKLYFFSTFVHVKKFTSSSFVSSIAVTAESDSGMKKLQSNVHLLVINISHTEDGCLYPCTHEGFIVNLRCTH